jgi:hypothetical protein
MIGGGEGSSEEMLDTLSTILAALYICWCCLCPDLYALCPVEAPHRNICAHSLPWAVILMVSFSWQ